MEEEVKQQVLFRVPKEPCSSTVGAPWRPADSIGYRGGGAACAGMRLAPTPGKGRDRRLQAKAITRDSGALCCLKRWERGGAGGARGAPWHNSCSKQHVCRPSAAPSTQPWRCGACLRLGAARRRLPAQQRSVGDVGRGLALRGRQQRRQRRLQRSQGGRPGGRRAWGKGRRREGRERKCAAGCGCCRCRCCCWPWLQQVACSRTCSGCW